MRKNEFCHILDYKSRKSRRVVRTNMVEGVVAFIAAFASSYILAKSIQRTLGKTIYLYMYTDSLKLFDFLTRGKQTNGKRLMIDILAVRESCKRYKIAGVRHIGGYDSPADGMTKRKRNEVLDEVIQTGCMRGEAAKWIDPDGGTIDTIPTQPATEAGV